MGALRLFQAIVLVILFGFATPVSAEPTGIRVNQNVLLEPIEHLNLDEAFHGPEFIHGDQAVVEIIRFSYENAAIEGPWQAVGIVLITEYNDDGTIPVGFRVWVQGEVTSGASEGLTATEVKPSVDGYVASFRLGLTPTRGTALLTIDDHAVVAVDGRRIGILHQ